MAVDLLRSFDQSGRYCHTSALLTYLHAEWIRLLAVDCALAAGVPLTDRTRPNRPTQMTTDKEVITLRDNLDAQLANRVIAIPVAAIDPDMAIEAAISSMSSFEISLHTAMWVNSTRCPLRSTRPTFRYC